MPSLRLCCSFPGIWPQLLQKVLHRAFCGPQSFTETLLLARICGKDDAFVHCHVQKEVLSHDYLDGLIPMLCLFDVALARHLETVILRNLGQQFGCRYQSLFFFLLFEGQWCIAAQDFLDTEVLMQKAAELPSVLIPSYVLTPLGISSSHWTAFFHGDTAFSTSSLKVELKSRKETNCKGPERDRRSTKAPLYIVHKCRD